MTTLHEERRQRIATVRFDYAAQPKHFLTRCNLCGHERFVVLTHRDRYHYPAQGYGCLRCGLVFLNPVMTADAYLAFYDGIYRPLVSAYHGRLIDAVTIQDEQREYAAERADLLAPYIESAGLETLLDLGGSTGVVSHHFAQRFRMKAAVLDPSPLELKQAQRLGLETITGLLEEFEPGERRFDLVIMCQTVDHLLDVCGAMRKVRTLLSERGLFYVDIVDLRAAYLRNNSIEEAIKADHPYYLTESTIVAYLLRAGFEVLRVDYAADHLHIGYVCRVAEPMPDYLPARREVDDLWREIRAVQNSPRSF
jgi:hypothetical protein